MLQERSNWGKTIIEKLEDESATIDIVFVLLTLDDEVRNLSDSDKQKRRARQIVIFEMGYFLGRFGQRGVRVILLHKGGVELPSDISGIAYIDISEGIKAADESIRRETKEWL